MNIVTLMLCSACLDMSIGSSIILNNSPSATLPKSLSKSSLTWLSKSTSPSSWCLRHCKTTLAFKEENSDHFKTLYQSICIYLFINSALHSNFDIIYNGIAFCSWELYFSFIGISQSIMATSYVKMIDIWMIFTMVLWKSLNQLSSEPINLRYMYLQQSFNINSLALWSLTLCFKSNCLIHIEKR